MPEVIAQFLDSFDRMSTDQQKIAVVEILRRCNVQVPDYEGLITEEDLVHMGDELFQMYDREEARNGTAETW